MPAHPTLRASVTADATNLGPGDPAPILVDGADTPITANGLANYTPLPGDRLLVQQVGGTVEVLQFISVGSVPYTETFRQDNPPSTTTTALGAIWYDTSDGASNPYRLELNDAGVPTWVALTINAAGLDVADVRANTVERGFVLGGGGVGVLSSGATNPTTAPTISNYYPTLQSFIYGTGQDVHIFFNGLTDYHADSTKWVTASVFTGTNIRVVRKSDMQNALLVDPTNGKTWTDNFFSHGGICRAGSTYWLIGTDNDRSSDFYLYQIDGTTWNKSAELRLGDINKFNSVNPRLVSDGTRVGYVWSTAAGDLKLKWFTKDTLVQTGSDITLLTGIGTQDVGDIYWGDGGTGLGASTMHVALGVTGSHANVMVWSSVTTTSATRQSAYDWKRPEAAKVNAMSLDSTTGHFWVIDFVGNARECSQIAQTNGSQSVTARYTYYDGDTGLYAGAIGSGTVIINGTDVSGTASTAHETGYSPTKTFTTDRRAWIRVTTGHAPDETNTDATKVDRANKIGVYIALGGGTMWRQAYGTVGQTVFDGFDTMPTTGTPDVHTFATAQVSLGVFESAATRLDGLPKWYMDGAGLQANIDGLIPPGTIVMWPSTTTPPGWYICDGASKTTAAEPDLFNVLGYQFGGSGANFNLPDFRSRFPFGRNIGGSTKGNIGDNEVGSAGTAPGAGDAGRLDHRHSHGAGTNVSLATNTTTTGTANRVTNTPSTLWTDTQGVNNGNNANHGLLTVNFIIKR